MQYTYTELAAYLLLYSFIGWALEVAFCSKRKKILQPADFSVCPLCPEYGIMMDILILLLPEQGDKMAAAVSDHLDGRVRCGIFFRRDRSQNLEKAFVELRGCDTVWREEKECAPFADQGSSCDDGGAAFASSGLYPVFDDSDNCAADHRHSRLWADGCRPGVDSDCSQEKQEPDRAEGNPGRLLQEQKEVKQKLGGKIYHAVWKRLNRAYPEMEALEEADRAELICLCKRRLCG